MSKRTVSDSEYEQIVAELREQYGELARRLSAAYASYQAGNALQTIYNKVTEQTVGSAWLVIAKAMVDLGPKRVCDILAREYRTLENKHEAHETETSEPGEGGKILQ